MDRYLPGVVRTVKTLFYRSNKKDKQGLVSRIFRKSSWQEMFAMAAMATGGSGSCRLNFLGRWWNSSRGRLPLHEGLRLVITRQAPGDGWFDTSTDRLEKNEFALSRRSSLGKEEDPQAPKFCILRPSDRVPVLRIWANPRGLCLSDDTCTADSPNPVGLNLLFFDVDAPYLVLLAIRHYLIASFTTKTLYGRSSPESLGFRPGQAGPSSASTHQARPDLH
nr:hypothetical protein B11B22.70 [imported] - Neurospora crassa [Neurospora crassa]